MLHLGKGADAINCELGASRGLVTVAVDDRDVGAWRAGEADSCTLGSTHEGGVHVHSISKAPSLDDGRERLREDVGCGAIGVEVARGSERRGQLMRRTADATEPVSAGERAGRSGANCLRRIGCWRWREGGWWRIGSNSRSSGQFCIFGVVRVQSQRRLGSNRALPWRKQMRAATRL